MWVASAAACRSGSAPPVVKSPAAQPAAASAPNGQAAPKPAAPARIVIAIVIDQLGSDTLLRQLPWLDAHGAIRTAIERGIYFERSRYPYATTLTAPGHVAIHTGAPPSVSGIDGNSAWDPVAEKPIPCIADLRYPVFGREAASATAGPVRLRVPTVAHALKEQTGGVAKVVSLSLKDRSAVLSVGTAADLALWWDSKLGRFTSSPVWAPELPAWVGRYQREHPATALLEPWLPLTPDEYAARLGPDAAPGEGNLDGFGTTFPHSFEHVGKPWAVVSLAPRSSEYLVELADAAIRAEGLGRDDVPDLLALSISGTDSAGHIFGPDSWEYVDHLVRADRALGAWLSKLEKTIPISVLVTSDHGVAPLPEKNPGRGGRIVEKDVEQRIEARLVQAFGKGPWLAGVMAPYVFLSVRARADPRSAELRAAMLEALRQETWLGDAWPLLEVRTWSNTADPLRRSLAAAVAPDTSADVMFVSREYQVLDLSDITGQGTNHGSPYDYDRFVPVLAWGVGVPQRRHSEAVDQLRVAATLAQLLKVKPPGAAASAPLF